MNQTQLSITTVLRRQFDPTFNMIENIISSCSDSIWINRSSGNPFWQIILHVLIGIEFWFRTENTKFQPPDFGNGIIPDIDQCPSFDTDKIIIRKYIERIKEIINNYFNHIDDDKLLHQSPIYNKCTYLDIIIGQIRHFQHHIGYLNRYLNDNNEKPTKWLGYGE